MSPATTAIYTLSLHDALPISAEQIVPDRGQPPSHRLAQEELAAVIQAALEGLNERQRMAVVLNKFEDMNYAEIAEVIDRKSTRLNSSHRCISYAVFCLKKKKK